MSERRNSALKVMGQRQIFSQPSSELGIYKKAATQLNTPMNRSRDVSPEPSPRSSEAHSPRGFINGAKSALNQSANLDMKRQQNTNPHNLSVREMVRTGKHSVFGIEGYVMPPVGKLLIQPRCYKWANDKVPGFIDKACKSKDFIPSPSKYSGHLEWKDLIKGNTGCFLKKERHTAASEIMKKGPTTPGPGAYEAQGRHKGLCIFKSNEPRTAFTDESMYRSTQTPAAIYNLNDKHTKPSPRTAKIYPPKTKMNTSIKIEKTNDPAPGLYNEDEAFKLTQIKKISYRIQGNTGKNFAEMVAKQKQFVPGAGAYKEVEKGFNKLSLSPRSLRRAR